MDPKLAVVLMVGVLAVSMGGSEAYRCYQCNSIFEKNCSDTFSSAGIRDCTGTACAKSKGSLQDASSVYRYCSDVYGLSNECYEESFEGYTATVCFCHADYCNDGQMVKQTFSKILFAVTMATFMAMACTNQFY